MHRSSATLLSAFLLAALLPLATAADTSPAGTHAPMGVGGDHLHARGGWMISYRAMRMEMDGNREGSERRSVDAVLAGYPVAPVEMDMEMHMLGLMWAPSDDVTLMGMLPLVRLDMAHRTGMGGSFVTRSHGLGDVGVSALVRVLEDEATAAHLNLGFTAPTGSISEKDDLPIGRMRLPYPMQLGSGTWDLRLGATAKRLVGDFTLGGQVLGTVRTGKNNKGYRLGNALEASAWLSWRADRRLSPSLRLAYHEWGNVRGDDDLLNPAMVPTADPARRGGRRLSLWAGAHLALADGPLAGAPLRPRGRRARPPTARRSAARDRLAGRAGLAVRVRRRHPRPRGADGRRPHGPLEVISETRDRAMCVDSARGRGAEPKA